MSKTGERIDQAFLPERKIGFMGFSKMLCVLAAVWFAGSIGLAATDVEKSDSELAAEAALWRDTSGKKGPLSYPKGNGVRMVSTGHSWVVPAMGTLPKIAAAAGIKGHRQRMHIRGGGNGAADSIWRREIGRTGNDRPILIPAIATGKWDVMTWGVYLNDKTEYFEQWIALCLEFNPEMEFYLQDAWTGTIDYKNEDKLNFKLFVMVQAGINARIMQILEPLQKKYPGKVHVIPVGNAMIEMLKLYYDEKLSGIEGLSSHLCGKKHALWSDGGHLGSYMNWWEGYCYYATIYKKSPELIDARFDVTEYNEQLDKIMRQCAWKAVVNHPLSGITDKNENGIADEIEETRDRNKAAGS
jgi:hypothetical protein